MPPAALALLVLLLVAAVVSFFLGERTDALIIGVILAASVGLGFVNEYRAERAAEALHSSIRHLVTAIRGGAPVELDVTALVPGDVVRLGSVRSSRPTSGCWTPPGWSATRPC